MLLCKLEREKIPRKKFSNNLDSNNFETKQSEKIQNIFTILAEKANTGKRGKDIEVGEMRGRFVTKLSNCFIDKNTRAVHDKNEQKKLLLILLSKVLRCSQIKFHSCGNKTAEKHLFTVFYEVFCGNCCSVLRSIFPIGWKSSVASGKVFETFHKFSKLSTLRATKISHLLKFADRSKFIVFES